MHDQGYPLYIPSLRLIAVNASLLNGAIHEGLSCLGKNLHVPFLPKNNIYKENIKLLLLTTSRPNN